MEEQEFYCCSRFIKVKNGSAHLNSEDHYNNAIAKYCLKFHDMEVDYWRLVKNEKTFYCQVCRRFISTSNGRRHHVSKGHTRKVDKMIDEKVKDDIKHEIIVLKMFQ